MSYHSESAKVRDMPHVMKYVTGKILDVGCGNDKITPEAIGVDGRHLEGVNIVTTDVHLLFMHNSDCDTVFSSHFLEHFDDPKYIMDCWGKSLKSGGHLVLYLPQKDAYNSHENPEHLYNWSYEDFLFMFKRCLCGEGKNFKGENLNKVYDLIDSGLDIGEDRYSFYVIARKV